MKKFLSMLFIATMLGMIFTACGDEKDEPAIKTQNLESVYESETETHFLFDINLDKDSSTIYIYNIVFRIGEATSPAMTLRFNAPVTVKGNEYTYAGTGIVADMLRGSTWMPMPGDSYLVNNLICKVDPKAKTYYITFDCHGGHFEESGKLR